MPMPAARTAERPTPAVPGATAWQRELQQAFTRPAELLAYLQLDPQLPALAATQQSGFSLRIPRPFAARMIKGDPLDPLFLQVWPSTQEALEIPGFHADPVGDLASLHAGGVIHKYQGRVLLVTTGACGVHCRYCFRRHFPYGEASAARAHWAQALDYIAADPSIHEVILSGGDPLSLSDDKLASLADALQALPQIKRLRLHTRQPVVLPQRVDEHLLGWLSRCRLDTVMVLHANHAQELDNEVAAACRKLTQAGVKLLNQSVLLRGINDSVERLTQLSERLLACGVLPYYLHLIDPVQGSAHFDVDEAMAKQLMRGLSARLPGYLVPRLARERAGEPAKQVLAW